MLQKLVHVHFLLLLIAVHLLLIEQINCSTKSTNSFLLSSSKMTEKPFKSVQQLIDSSSSSPSLFSSLSESRKSVNFHDFFTLRPVKKVTRIKLIKMLIKQIRRVARVDSNQLSSKSKANQTSVEASSLNSTHNSIKTSEQSVDLLKMKPSINQIKLIQQEVPLLDSNSINTIASPLQPVYTWDHQPVPQVQFWPASSNSNPLPLIQSDGQTMQLQLPLNQLPFNQLPVFINDQLRTEAGQRVVNSVIANQWLQIRRSTSEPETARRRWKRFVQKVKSFASISDSKFKSKKSDDVQTSRLDPHLLHEGITRILGGLLGDLVGVVVEEVLQKKGEIIANGIRLIVGDIATFVLSKGNLALEVTLRNLSKTLFFRS